MYRHAWRQVHRPVYIHVHRNMYKHVYQHVYRHPGAFIVVSTTTVTFESHVRQCVKIYTGICNCMVT